LNWRKWLVDHVAASYQEVVIRKGEFLHYMTVKVGNDTLFFIKHYLGTAGVAQCQAEAQGLQALSAALAADSPLRVAMPVAVGDDWIILPYVESQPATREAWIALGEGLARLHSTSVGKFGFDSDNFCGPTPQPNLKIDDGYEFFAQQRLGYQAKINFDAGNLSPTELTRLEGLSNRLRELVPQQSAALLHGDLWSGNVLVNAEQQPYLIDPACHCGWPEAELAMTQLFGGFASEFYQAYERSGLCLPGWRERADIYNLYHLLNHLYLFGGSYHRQVMAVLTRYT